LASSSFGCREPSDGRSGTGLAALVAADDRGRVMRPGQRQAGQAVVRSRPVSVLVVGLALAPLMSGCGGASPEARARQTVIALRGTSTPTRLQAVRAAIDQGTVTGIDQESAAILTAEAYLPIATPMPPNVSTIMVGTVAATRGAGMTEPELTEAMITAAMAKAEARVCVGHARCYAFPDRLEDALASCTSKGRCQVGWILRMSGHESWDVWLEVSSGLVVLVLKAHA
jgi:hypothetical protein